MLDLSPEKVLLLGVIALVVLGPDRLPQAARSLGRFVVQLRRMSASFQSEVRDALAEPADALGSAVGEIRTSDIRRSVRDGISSTMASFSAPPEAAAGSGDRGGGPPWPEAPGPDDPSLN